jgi:Zn-dependent metalloprotease
VGSPAISPRIRIAGAVLCLLTPLGAQPLPTETLRADLLGRAASLGLGPEDGLRPLSRQTDPLGGTLVRFQQTHRGLPVFGTTLLARTDRAGQLLASLPALEPGIRLAEGTLIGPDRALKAVLEDLALSFQAVELSPPAVDLVVFPSRFTGGLVYRKGPQEGLFEPDWGLSVTAGPPAEAQVQAYRVETRHQDPLQGVVARTTFVEGRTGQILRKEVALRTTDIPVRVPGRSQYSGTVTLDAVRRPDGQLQLRDTTRPLLAHALQAELLGPGLPAANLVFTTLQNGTTAERRTFLAPGTAFGDGATFDYVQPYGADLLLGSNGQTAAADVAYGLQVAWDLLRDVALRPGGPDGAGGALAAEVHALLSPQSPYANASWDPATRRLAFGDGGYGYLPFTSLDIVAHEVGHALMSATADLHYTGESGGLNEANSDILGLATAFYGRAGGRGGTLPEPGPEASWVLGEQLFPAGSSGPIGLRSLARPSRFYLPDAWFDGIDIFDVHSIAGPCDRFFYYLARGSDPRDPETRSVFLTAGLQGVGLQRAFQIWYRALTAWVGDPATDYAGMRRATEGAATELFGAGSPELQAVQNAWAAVNVGPPAGQATAPRLRLDPGPFPASVDPDSVIQARSRDLFVNIGGAAPFPRVLAEGFSTPPALLWSSAFAVVDPVAGTLRPSTWNAVGWSTSFDVAAAGTPYKATGMLNPVVLDLDGDGESDAADAAVLAIYAMTGVMPDETYGRDQLPRLLSPRLAIYRWNRAFQALATPGRKG